MKSLGRIGFNRGWFCMSSRHASPGTKHTRRATTLTRFLQLPRACLRSAIGHLLNPTRIQADEEGSSVLEIEIRVFRLDTKEEAIARCRCESLHVEQWVKDHGKAVQRPHSKKCAEAGEQNSHLEGWWNERRPGMEWPPADVNRIGDHIDPVLQHVRRRTSQDSPDEAYKRHGIL